MSNSVLRSAFLGLVGAAALAASPAMAGVIVGSNDSGNCYPFLCNDSGTSSGQSIDYQQAYNHTAFSGPITIHSLTFFFAPAFGGNSDVLAGDYSFYLSYAANPFNALSSSLTSNVSGSQSLFFSGHANGTDSMNPSITLTGTPFAYDPSLGDLLLEVVVSNQANVPNFSGNGYDEADYTGAQTTRAYCLTNGSCTGSTGGALVTEFNAATATPEPVSLSLLGAGLAGLGALRRRKATRA